MESRGTTTEAESTTDFRCVQCGYPVKTLYIQYSPGNIRLMKCGNCKAVADGYIECEIMILILDLILHKPKAYRHVFYNMFRKETVNFESLLWKSVFACLILDICIHPVIKYCKLIVISFLTIIESFCHMHLNVIRYVVSLTALDKMWVLSTNERERPLPASVASLLLEFGKMLTGVIFGNLAFIGVVFYATRKFLGTSTEVYGWKQILFAVLLSSYFKIFLLAMMVWEFPSSVIVIIDIFVLSSNIVALKVITNSVMMRCLAVCVMAHGLKFLASQNKAFVLQS